MYCQNSISFSVLNISRGLLRPIINSGMILIGSLGQIWYLTIENYLIGMIPKALLNCTMLWTTMMNSADSCQFQDL